MKSKRSFVSIQIERGSTSQQLEFPEEDNFSNRLRWWTAGVLTKMEVNWFG